MYMPSCRSSSCFIEHEEDGKQDGGQDTPLLDAVGDGEAARQ